MYGDDAAGEAQTAGDLGAEGTYDTAGADPVPDDTAVPDDTSAAVDDSAPAVDDSVPSDDDTSSAS
jgi:hypothetical protein